MLKLVLNTSTTSPATSNTKTKTTTTISKKFTNCKLNVILLTIVLQIIMLNFMLISVTTKTIVVAAEASEIPSAIAAEVFEKMSVTKDDQRYDNIVQQHNQQQHQQQHQQQPLSTNNNNMNRVEEYFMEHRVNEKDAAHSFRLQVNDLLNRKIPAWCMACTPQVIRYCLSNQMLQDHCCCDSQHGKELLPWLPHSCYMGQTCEPIIGSCMQYTELKECCCDRLMANQWKDIFSSSTKNTLTFNRKEFFLLELLLYFFLYKFIIR